MLRNVSTTSAELSGPNEMAPVFGSTTTCDTPGDGGKLEQCVLHARRLEQFVAAGKATRCPRDRRTHAPIASERVARALRSLARGVLKAARTQRKWRMTNEEADHDRVPLAARHQ